MLIHRLLEVNSLNPFRPSFIYRSRGRRWSQRVRNPFLGLTNNSASSGEDVLPGQEYCWLASS